MLDVTGCLGRRGSGDVVETSSSGLLLLGQRNQQAAGWRAVTHFVLNYCD